MKGTISLPIICLIIGSVYGGNIMLALSFNRAGR